MSIVGMPSWPFGVWIENDKAPEPPAGTVMGNFAHETLNPEVTAATV
jgi:hypothetical protein